MPEPKRPAEEDELDELPAIDGGDGDGEEETDPENLDDDEPPEDGGDPFDDATGENDPVEEAEVSGDESGWLDDAGDSEGLDVGTPDTFSAEEEGSVLLEGAEEADDAGMEDDLPEGGADADGRSLVGDAGEEGFADEEEEVREEDLPRLDADGDETEMDDADLLGELPDEAVGEEPRPPWDDRAWERVDVGLAGLAGVAAFSCGPAGLVVAGQGLARIDRAGRVTALEGIGLRGGAPRAIAVDGDFIVVSTPRAGVLVSKDGGAAFQEANGWQELLPADQREGGLDLVLAGEDLWGRGRSGALFWSPDRGATWARARVDHPVEAIAGDAAGAEIVTLSHAEPGGRGTP